MEEFDSDLIKQYDIIVFGSRLHIGKVDKLDKFKRTINAFDKKIIVFATGGTPEKDENAITDIWNNSLTREEQDNIPHFYMQGGLSYDKMKLMDRFLMRSFAWFSQKKGNKDPVENGRAKALQTSYDASSKKYIYPLIEYIKSLN